MTKINRVINPQEGRLQGTTEWCPLLAFKFWGVGVMSWYSQLLITQAFKGNRKKLKFPVIKSSEQITRNKEEKIFTVE